MTFFEVPGFFNVFMLIVFLRNWLACFKLILRFYEFNKDTTETVNERLVIGTVFQSFLVGVCSGDT